MEEEKPIIEMKEFAMLLVSAIVGALLSLHVFLIYQNNNNQMPELSFGFIGNLIVIGGVYLGVILIAILAITLVMSAFTKYSELFEDFTTAVKDFIVKKLNIKRRKKRKKLFKISNKQQKEIWNLVFLLFIFILLIVYAGSVLKYIKGFYFALLIATLILFIHRILLLRKLRT